MDHTEVRRYWNANADAWTELARAGYDVYRDYLNTPAFFDMLPHVDGLSGLDIGNEPCQSLLNILALPGFKKVQGLTAQCIALFNEIGVVALLCQVPGGGHPGKSPADYQCRVVHFYFRVIQRFQQTYFGNRHTHQIFGFCRGGLGITTMHP